VPDRVPSGGPLRIAFLGNADWSVPSLESLDGSRHDVVLVLTRAPRPSGRGRRPAPTEVADAAGRLGIPLGEIATVRDGDGMRLLRDAEPDVLAVVAYGEILSMGVLSVPRLMPVNVHFSLLPMLRGAAPVQRAILEGLTRTGVTTMRMDEGLDTGPILMQTATGIGDTEDAGTLGARLAGLGGPLLVQTIDALADGVLQETPQDQSDATFAPKLTSDDEALDWTRPTDEILRRIRALSPSPGGATTFRGRRLKVLRAGRDGGQLLGPDATPGSVVAGRVLLVAAGRSPRETLRLDEVQPEGKRRMSGEEFLRGYRPQAGERLG